MTLLNPYLDFFLTLPPTCRRNPAVPRSLAALMAPDWQAFSAAVARHFAWAVPTEEAIAAIRKPGSGVVEIGAGSGYWAWLMQQAGIEVAAFDLDPPPFTWAEVQRGDERAAAAHPDKTLLLCWPPWATGVASRALAAYRGEHVAYVGEWMGFNAEPEFFAALLWSFECIDVVDIPQWYMRDDRLMVFRRRSVPGAASPRPMSGPGMAD
jgi:hypothetical protein